MTNSLPVVESIAVISGPSKVNVALDIGPQGQRGSNIFTGNLEPEQYFTEEVIASLSPQLYDLYIVVDSQSASYGYVYQYQFLDNAFQWEPVAEIYQSPNYTPAVSANWTTQPTTIAEALDQLASRLSALE